MGIALIIFLILLLCWPTISKWISRWAARFVARRSEEILRKAMGMPPHPDSCKENKKQKGNRQEAYSSTSGYGRRKSSGRRRTGYSSPGPIIPKEYAEDVEFVEVKSFSETEIASDRTAKTETYYHESQVSDVEYVEIKNPSRKK